MQSIIVDTWTNYKSLLSSKTMTIQYEESSTDYKLYAPEAGAFLWTIILNKGTSDATDFETNYKPTANAPLMINGGTVMTPQVAEAQVLNALAIRDTNPHTSSTGNSRGFMVKTVIVNNGLNQDVAIQLQGSRDSTNWFNVGNPATTTATTLTYQTADDYFPYVRAVATCAVAPASGNLDLWVEFMGE
jgi:hypothetical protein